MSNIERVKSVKVKNEQKAERKWASIDKIMESYIYPTSGTMVKKGISTRTIKEMKASGKLLTIKRGLYRVSDKTISEHQDFVDIAQAVPGGVICLASALAYHDLATFNPSYVSVAIQKGSRIPVVDYPPAEFFIFNQPSYELGIEKVNAGIFSFKIYDKEKTVCDCIRFRNKIGFDLAREGLREYLKLKERDLDRLSRYAEVCRVKTVMNTWLDILV